MAIARRGNISTACHQPLSRSATQANGTGPYQLDHWTPGAEIVLTANAGYRQGPPKIDRVEIKTIGNFEQRLQLLRARDADLIDADHTRSEQARLDELVRETVRSAAASVK